MRAEIQSGSIEVHTLRGPERRMLLEMLASERCGEEALHVGTFARDAIADLLCGLSMSHWVAREYVTFTEYGRYVAESLAQRLVVREKTLEN